MGKEATVMYGRAGGKEERGRRGSDLHRDLYRPLCHPINDQPPITTHCQSPYNPIARCSLLAADHQASGAMDMGCIVASQGLDPLRRRTNLSDNESIDLSPGKCGMDRPGLQRRLCHSLTVWRVGREFGDIRVGGTAPWM